MNMNNVQASEVEIPESDAQSADQQLEKISEYIYVENNNIFINEEILNESSLDINQEDLSYFEEYYSDINKMADNGEITIDEETLDIVQEGTITTASSGTTVNYYWWGAEIYMNQTNALTVAQDWKAAGSGGGTVAAITRLLPSPPTWIASAILGAVSGSFVYYGNVIENNTTANGVRLEVRLPSGLYAYPR